MKLRLRRKPKTPATYGNGRTEDQEHADDSAMIRDGIREAFGPTVARDPATGRWAKREGSE